MDAWGGCAPGLPLLEHGRTYGLQVTALGLNWHTLGIEIRDDIFTVSLDEVELRRVQDTTFSEAGHVGLWTKADAVTWFDELLIVELPSANSVEGGALDSTRGQ